MSNWLKEIEEELISLQQGDQQELAKRIRKTEKTFSSMVKYRSAPSMLLDTRAEIMALIEKHKAVNGEDDTWRFFKKISDHIFYGCVYMSDLSFIYEENNILSSKLDIAEKCCAIYQEELNKYRITEDAVLSGEMISIIKNVVKKLNNA